MEQGQSDDEMRRAVAALVGHAVHQLESGRSPVEVEREFVERGFNHEVSRTLVQRALQLRYERAPGGPQSAPRFARVQEQEQESDGHTDMAVGALICIGGIIITAATYSAASGGGTYVVAWGAIIFGAIRFFKGLAR